MVSVVVVGPAMSGKTTLCGDIVGLGRDARPVFAETCSASYLSVLIDGVEYHVWDTPRLDSIDSMRRGWVGENALDEADIVIVCHDGRHAGPVPLVNACGPDRCIVALTKSGAAAADISYLVDYLRTVRSDSRLVPRVRGRAGLLARMWLMAPRL